MSYSPWSYPYNNQFGPLTSLSSTFYIGLSFTKPYISGGGIAVPSWTNYSNQQQSLFGWTLSNGVWTNNSTINFGEVNINSNTNLQPASSDYTLNYFFILDNVGAFLAAGPLIPNANLTNGSVLYFLPGNIMVQDNFNSPNYFATYNSAFPTVIAPTFSPTFEPAALGQPILYGLNMRS